MVDDNDYKAKKKELDHERNNLLIAKFLSKSGLVKCSEKDICDFKKKIITKSIEINSINRKKG
jgi:hypothetical protein